jgi:hypothetical protein
MEMAARATDPMTNLRACMLQRRRALGVAYEKLLTRKIVD